LDLRAVAQQRELVVGEPIALEPMEHGDAHYALVVKAMSAGRVTPFLGAGASLCGRPDDAAFKPGQSPFLPRGSELAHHLASEFYVPLAKDSDLLRVSQYVDVMAGRDWLYEQLHALFSASYEPNAVHRFLAQLPRRLFRERDLVPRYQVIVTTNYDDSLERAFDAENEAYHLVWYLAEGEHQGRFMHRAPGADPVVVDTPNEYIDVTPNECTVILKIHGAVSREDRWQDSYVITEDHYIDFLSRGTEITSLIPVGVAARLKVGSFLFLGYSLRDWNLRVILNRLWRDQRLPSKSWAIQKESEEYDRQFWSRRNVEIRAEDLADYVERLQAHVTGPSIHA
jgi:SIR2-like domain